MQDPWRHFLVGLAESTFISFFTTVSLFCCPCEILEDTSLWVLLCKHRTSVSSQQFLCTFCWPCKACQDASSSASLWKHCSSVSSRQFVHSVVRARLAKMLHYQCCCANLFGWFLLHGLRHLPTCGFCQHCSSTPGFQEASLEDQQHCPGNLLSLVLNVNDLVPSYCICLYVA